MVVPETLVRRYRRDLVAAAGDDATVVDALIDYQANPSPNLEARRTLVNTARVARGEPLLGARPPYVNELLALRRRRGKGSGPLADDVREALRRPSEASVRKIMRMLQVRLVHVPEVLVAAQWLRSVEHESEMVEMSREYTPEAFLRLAADDDLTIDDPAALEAIAPMLERVRKTKLAPELVEHVGEGDEQRTRRALDAQAIFLALERAGIDPEDVLPRRSELRPREMGSVRRPAFRRSRLPPSSG